MLKPAKMYENELNALFAQYTHEERMKWWQLNYEDREAKIEDSNYRVIQMASVKDDKVIGFLSAEINRNIYAVDTLGCAHFIEDSKNTFAADIVAFIKSLVYEHKFRKINWAVIKGNPVEKHYDRICKKMGGRIVGVKRYDVFIRGEYYDRKMYEWINDYHICTHCGHKEKKEQEIMCWHCGLGEMVYVNPFR